MRMFPYHQGGLLLSLTAARKHHRQFSAAQRDWLGRKTPMPPNPGTDPGGIGGREEAGFRSGGIFATLPGDPKGGVKAQYGLWRDADTIAWDRAQHQRTGGEARPVDHHSLTGLPQDREQFEIWANRTAGTCQDAHLGASWRRGDDAPERSKERTSHRNSPLSIAVRAASEVFRKL